MAIIENIITKILMRVQRMKNTISAKNKYEPDAASAGQKEVLHEKERKDKCRTQRRSRKTYRRSPLLGDPQIGCLRHGAHAAPTKTNKCPTYGSWTDKKAAQNARLSSAFRRQIISGCRPRANRAPTGASLRLRTRELFFEFRRVLFKIHFYDAHHLVVLFLRFVKEWVGDGSILPFRGI